MGCGRLAEAGYLPAIRSLPGIRLVAVAEPHAARRERFAALAPGAVAYASLEELLARESPEALIVASPPTAHVEHAELAAQAGVLALVEKPPALDADGARRLAELRPAPCIGFNRRFQPGLRPAEQVPANGPLEAELELRYRRRSWRAHSVRDEALLDLGPHLVDLALLLTDARPLAVRHARLGPERAELELLTDRGRAILRCATDRRHLERIELRRPSGMAVARSRIGGPTRGIIARLRQAGHPLASSLAPQLEALARARRGGNPGPLASAEDGIAVMRVLDAARESARRGGAEVPIG